MLTLYELEAHFARHNVNVCHIIQKIIVKKGVKYLLSSNNAPTLATYIKHTSGRVWSRSGLLTRPSIRGVLYRMFWAVKFDHEVDIKKLVDFLCSDGADARIT